MQMEILLGIGMASNRGAAEKFVDECLASGRYGCSVDDAARATGLGERSAKDQLRRLGKRVTRVARWQSFFVIKGESDAAFGGPGYDRWLDDYFAWLGHAYYVGLHSAAAIHGSQPQALQTIQVVTDAPRRDVVLGRQRLRFFVKSRCRFAQVQDAPGAFAPMKVSTLETTLFDLVRYAPRIGGIARVAETIRPLLRLVKSASLKRVLETENEVATMQRLGFLFEKMECGNLAAVVAKQLPDRLVWVSLGCGAKYGESAPRSERWRVVVNIEAV
jgi:predicted transcriptional regulator of viral defense system